MEWAFQRGTSTKAQTGGGPCGLGLDLLRSFVRLNGGNLEMFSHEGHALITPDSVQFSSCASFFPGTLVTITLICDEEYYHLNSEPPGRAPF
jgi:signal transduction histidine kinase